MSALLPRSDAPELPRTTRRAAVVTQDAIDPGVADVMVFAPRADRVEVDLPTGETLELGGVGPEFTAHLRIEAAIDVLRVRLFRDGRLVEQFLAAAQPR